MSTAQVPSVDEVRETFYESLRFQPYSLGRVCHKASVLALYWEDDDQECIEEAKQIVRLFSEDFSYQTALFGIPSVCAEEALRSEVQEFLAGHDESSSVLIIYYCGYNDLNKGAGGVWTTRRERGPTLRWHSIQPLLDYAKTDMLLIFDCCYAAQVVHRQNAYKSQLLAASAMGVRASPVGSKSFTSALISQTRLLLKEYGSVSIAYLRYRLSEGKASLQQTPIHINLLDRLVTKPVVLRPLCSEVVCRFAEAVGVLDRLEVLGSGKTIQNLATLEDGNLAQYHSYLERCKEALELYNQVLASQTQEVQGSDYSNICIVAQDIAHYLNRSGRHMEAIDLFQQVLASQDRVLGKKHLDTLATGDSLARTFSLLGRHEDLVQLFIYLERFEDALPLYQEILANQTKTLGEEHADTLATAHNLAKLLGALGRHEEAVGFLRKVLASRKRTLGGEAPATLDTACDLAQLFIYLERFEDVLALYQEILAGQTKTLGEEHADTLATAHNLAKSLGFLSRHEEAVGFLERVLASRTTVLGRDYPTTLGTALDLAHNLRCLGRYEMALETSWSVLALQRESLGEEHLDTLDTAIKVADDLNYLKRYGQAQELYEQVLSSRERIVGENRPRILAAKHNIAKALSGLCRYSEAVELYKDVLLSRKEILGDGNSDTLDTTFSLAQSLNCLNQYEEALEFYEQALPNREKVLGKEHPEVLSAKYNMAMILSRDGRYDDAIKFYEQVLLNQKEILGNDDPSTLETIQGMAYALSCLGKFEEPMKWYRQILASQEKSLGKEHLSTLATIQSMASVLANVGWHQQAVELYREVLISRRRILGEQHSDTLDTTYNLAQSLISHERYGEALELYGKILSGREEILGKQHPETLGTAKMVSVLKSLSQNETILGALETGREIPGLEDFQRRPELLRPGKVPKSHGKHGGGGRGLEREDPDALTTTHSTVAAAARSNPRAGRDEDTLGSLRQILIDNEKLLEKPSGTSKAVSDMAPVSNDTRRPDKALRPGDQALLDARKPIANKDQRNLDIVLLLETSARLLKDTSWRIKYTISRLEFSMIRALESNKISKEFPKRVHWKCTCGANHFDDFRDLSHDHPDSPLASHPNGSTINSHSTKSILSLRKYFSFGGWGLLGGDTGPTASLKLSKLGIPISNPSYSPQGGTNISNSALPAQPPQAGSNSSSLLPRGSNHPHIPPPVQPPRVRPSISSMTQAGPTSSSIDKYIFLCFNDQFVRLLHHNLTPIIDDQTIFRNMREAYYNYRGWWRSHFSFEVLKRVEFVQFELYYRDQVEICIRNHLPPEDNQDYEYHPKPNLRMPPITGFMYFFHNPECVGPSNSDALLTKMPKKISGPLSDREYGWGIHFIEEPCMFRVYLLACLIVIIDLVFAVVWSVVKKDIQGGFGIAAFITSVGAVFIAIGWRQATSS